MQALILGVIGGETWMSFGRGPQTVRVWQISAGGAEPRETCFVPGSLLRPRCGEKLNFNVLSER